MPHEDGVILYKELSRYDYNIKKYIYDKLKDKSNYGHAHNDFIGASEESGGIAGFVPSPIAGSSNRYLCSDGTWKEVDVADEKVIQNNTANDNDYRIMLSFSDNNTTENNQLRKSSKFTANPSTGEFFARGYRRIDISNETSFNLNSITLSSGYPNIQKYIRKNTNNGSVINSPTTTPFTLDVELLSWNSSSNYVTRQTLVASNSIVYRRICNSGSWEQWRIIKYTDTTYTDFVGSTALNIGKTGLVPAPSAGSNNRYLCADGSWSSIELFTGSSSAGLVPKPSSGINNRYLRNDGQWNPIDLFTSASKAGLVPVPLLASEEIFLCSDGSWSKTVDTTYDVVSTSDNGLMSSDMLTKLNGIAENANNYIHPTLPGNKHIPSGGSSGKILKWAGDGTAIWDNELNTTYSTFYTNYDGLVPGPYSSTSSNSCLKANGSWGRPYSYGSTSPSGGSAGDVYFKYS